MKQFRTLLRLSPVLLFALACLAAGPARAGTCSNPAGIEGAITYNKDYHTFQFCNGTKWISWDQNPTYWPSGGTSWNPSDKGAQITLSGGNLLATQSSSLYNWYTVRSNTSHTVGTNYKVVFAITVSAYDNSNGWDSGLADSTTSLSGEVGSSGNSIGSQIGGAGTHASGSVTVNNSCTGGALGVGVTQYYAVDFNTGKVWCSSANCTSWGTNPDSGTNPNVTLPSATAFFLAWSGRDWNASDAGTLNASPSLAGCTGVSTFTTWN